MRCRFTGLICNLLIVFILLSGMYNIKCSAEEWTDLCNGKITIVNTKRKDFPRMVKAIEIFHRRYPNIEVCFHTEDDPRILNAAIMAGTPGYDIIGIQESGMFVASPFLYRSGCFVNLLDYPCIEEQLEDYLDIFRPMSYANDMYGVPELIYPTVWEVNALLAEKIGISVPAYEWTWDEFFAICDQVNAYNTQNQTDYCVLHDGDVLPYLIKQHNSNTIDVASGCGSYATEQYMSYLHKWISANAQGLIDSTRDSAYKENNPDTLFYVTQVDYNRLQFGSYIAPPASTLEVRYPVNALHLAVNSNSVLKDAAVYFLSCYLAPEAVLTEPLVYCGQWLKDVSLYSTDYLSISEENQALWVFMLEHGTQYYYIGDIVADQWQTLYPQMISGGITPESFVQTVLRRAEFVLME